MGNLKILRQLAVRAWLILAYQAPGCRICTSSAIIVYNSSTELDTLSISANLEATVADSLSDLEDSPESAMYVKSQCFYT